MCPLDRRGGNGLVGAYINHSTMINRIKTVVLINRRLFDRPRLIKRGSMELESR